MHNCRNISETQKVTFFLPTHHYRNISASQTVTWFFFTLRITTRITESHGVFPPTHHYRNILASQIVTGFFRPTHYNQNHRKSRVFPAYTSLPEYFSITDSHGVFSPYASQTESQKVTGFFHPTHHYRTILARQKVTYLHI